jgi:Putative transcription activator
MRNSAGRSITVDIPDNYPSYTDSSDDVRFTEWCQALSQPDWTAAVEHRFTEQLHEGTIDDAVFRRYLVQDYAFVESLVGTFGHALGEASSMKAKGRLGTFIDTLTADENDYFERSLDALDVPESDRREPDLMPATRAFEDLLERVAREGGYAETLAVLVPAEWIYRAWAGVDAEPPEQFYLAEWIGLHNNPGFNEFVEWIRTELDREGAAAASDRQQRLARHFHRTVELEIAFFDAAYTAKRDDQTW